MLDPDFRLNLDGFEELYLQREIVDCCTHLSAYSPSLNIEIAVLDHADLHDNDCAVELMMAYALDTPARGHNGRIFTDENICSEHFKVFDPLVIRCIALEWVATYGGKTSTDA